MAMKYGVSVKNARLDAVESTIGTSAKLYLRTGAPPTLPSDADSGTLLATIDLPSDWMGAAASGVKAKAGVWSSVGVAADNIGHFRIKDSSGTTTGIQGTVTATDGGGDMTVNSVSIAVDQEVTVTAFQLTSGN